MPGPYAHITLLHELIRPDRLESIFSPSSEFHDALAAHFPYCALGAVSPDYPNLAWRDGVSFRWADAMHCTRACEMIASGIRRVRGARGAARDKQLAWLLGYCAHVAADVTIHPIVQARVGVYAENRCQHRICEMNQDSYIFRRMNLGEIGESDNFALTVALCNNSDDRNLLDRDIVMLWEGMLADVHSEMFIAHPPDCASWHRKFIALATGCAASDIRLFPLASVISTKMGLAYPTFATIDRLFIEEQIVPTEKPHCLHYDDIFNHAADNVVAVWRRVERLVCAVDTMHMPMFSDWNLDTGRDEHDSLVFWRHIN